jgi:outer membrane protein assembly factor BamB
LPDRVLFANDKGRFMMVSAGHYDRGSVIWTDQVGTAPLEPLVGLTSEKRREAWPKHAETTPLEPIFLDYEDLYFTGSDQIVYSINPNTGPENGQCRWRRALAGKPSEGPVVAGGLVFQQDPAQGLLAIDRVTGRLRWLLARGQRLLARAGGVVYVLGTDGRLLVADEATGSLRSGVSITGVRYAPADSMADAVFLADRQGRIMCVRNPDANPLKRSDFVRVISPATRPVQTQPTTASAPAAAEAPPATAPAVSNVTSESGDVLRSKRP